MAQVTKAVVSRCGDWENCIAYSPEDEKCKTTNGCMTEENVRAYLEWCKRSWELTEDLK